MPMDRFRIRNEFGLGKPELYNQAVKEEDPKLILDGLTVSGLVGVLRLLGDLAEFAAEVFHGLQEDAMMTASRSQKLMVRVQHIEAILPSLEKAALAQTSHIHFAYTAGSDWHAHIHNRQHHFIDNDLPCFIMDYYEECRDPPRLHLLDKFDTDGPGSCLRRYSDPTFFRSTSAKSDKNAIKIQRDKKAHKIKRKRSFAKKGEVSCGMSTYSPSGRLEFTTEATNGLDSPVVSMADLTFKSDIGNHLSSFDTRGGSSHIECIFHRSSEMQPEEQKTYKYSSPRKMQQIDGDDFYSEVTQEVSHKSPEIKSFDQIVAKPPSVIWDENAEISESEDRSGTDQASVSLSPKSNLIHSDHFDEATRMVNPMFPQTSPGNHFVSRPHSDSWYEKTDMVELDDGKSCQEEGLVTLSTRSDLDVAQRENFVIRGVDFDQLRQKNTGELDIRSHDDMSKSFYNENELDDTGSEHDNFEDALNTIESECESDLDSKTKQGAEQSSFDNKEVKSVLHELPSHNAVACSSNSGFGNASFVLLKEVSPDSPKSISSEADFAPELKCQVADESALSGGLPRFNVNENGDVHDVPKVEFNTGEPSISAADEIRSSFGNLQDLTAEGVKFWTNGSLLGLAPAKPPDFAAANAVHQDSVVKIKDILQSEHQYKLNDDKCEPKVVCSTEKVKGKEKEASARFSIPCSISQDSNVSSQKSPLKDSQGVPHLNFSGSIDVNRSNKVGYTSGGGTDSICVITPGSTRPVAPTDKAAYTEAVQESSDSSSGVFVFGQKFLVNSFRKKMSLVLDENTEPVSPIETNFLEQSRGHHSTSHLTSQEGSKTHPDFETVSLVNSLPPSPPINHMKISFHPVNRIEASKLTLKFPGEESRQENTSDIFAAFQLVQEHAGPLCDAGSDTDDNTFCQSSYVSDDCLSHHSDSNSEDWESGETAEGKGGDQYGAFCGLSSTESSLSSLENGGMASYRISGDGSTESPQSKSGVEPTLPFSANACATFDLPSFDSLDSALNKENNPLSDPKSPLESTFSSQSTPPPPPLPPVQWRLLKSCPDRTECEQKSEHKSTNNLVDSMLPVSDVSLKPRKTSDKESHNNLIEEIVAVTMKRKEQQKLNSDKEAYRVGKIKEIGEKKDLFMQIKTNEQQMLKSNTEAYQVAKVKEMDEKEDFLQQIRTKSFNLRPMATARPSVTTASTTNIKVTAILEKANAIRQAVGSDGGDDDDGDDSWSDN